MGDGLVPKQMKHTPSSPWLTSLPRATPSFISARQQGTQTPAALLKLLQSCQSPPDLPFQLLSQRPEHIGNRQ
jgi:hypothetical protein